MRAGSLSSDRQAIYVHSGRSDSNRRRPAWENRLANRRKAQETPCFLAFCRRRALSQGFALCRVFSHPDGVFSKVGGKAGTDKCRLLLGQLKSPPYSRKQRQNCICSVTASRADVGGPSPRLPGARIRPYQGGGTYSPAPKVGRAIVQELRGSAALKTFLRSGRESRCGMGVRLLNWAATCDQCRERLLP